MNHTHKIIPARAYCMAGKASRRNWRNLLVGGRGLPVSGERLDSWCRGFYLGFIVGAALVVAGVWDKL